MPIFDKVNGVYRKVSKSHSKVNGVWRQDKKIYDRVNGVWREAFSGAVEWTYRFFYINNESDTVWLYVDEKHSGYLSYDRSSEHSPRGGKIVYEFTSPFLLRAGSKLTIEDHIDSRFLGNWNVLINDKKIATDSGAPSGDNHSTQTIFIDEDLIVYKIYISMSVSYKSSDYMYCNVFISPLGDNTFMLNSSGTSDQ